MKCEKFEKWWMKEPVSEFSGVDASHVYKAWNAAIEHVLGAIETVRIDNPLTHVYEEDARDIWPERIQEILNAINDLKN